MSRNTVDQPLYVLGVRQVLMSMPARRYNLMLHDVI